MIVGGTLIRAAKKMVIESTERMADATDELMDAERFYRDGIEAYTEATKALEQARAFNHDAMLAVRDAGDDDKKDSVH